MIEILDRPLSPEEVVRRAKTPGSGCVVTYVGLIRDNSHGKRVKSVEYRDTSGRAKERLQQIAAEARQKWPLENVAIYHRVGMLQVGDINLVVAVAAAHRGEGLEACRFIVDNFKSRLPTAKTETYLEG
jgi:molybdopterin synthase catalytic subunit